jgi:cytochrome d ubiquinol oxidase subunit I
MSVAAYYVLKNRHIEFAKRSFTIALVFGTVMSLAQLLTGHSSARQVAMTQPAKLAAFEGLYQTPEGGAPLYLFGHPDGDAVRYGLKIPGMLSFLVHDDFTKPVTGLDKFKPEDRPPVAITFHAYHIMVGLGMTFIGLTLLASFLRWRGTLFGKRWLLLIFVFAVTLPYIANQLGWVAAEVGRQPWVVYGLLRTADAVSTSVSAAEVLASIVMFSVIYGLLFAVWILVLNDKIQHGPDEPAEPPDRTTTGKLPEADAGPDKPGALENA